MNCPSKVNYFGNVPSSLESASRLQSLGTKLHQTYVDDFSDDFSGDLHKDRKNKPPSDSSLSPGLGRPQDSSNTHWARGGDSPHCFYNLWITMIE